MPHVVYNTESFDDGCCNLGSLTRQNSRHLPWSHRAGKSRARHSAGHNNKFKNGHVSGRIAIAFSKRIILMF
jgi:hypothetical protein